MTTTWSLFHQTTAGPSWPGVFGQHFNAPIAIVDQRGARYDDSVHDMIGDVKGKKCIIVTT
jgi:ribose-phosphate pyrophosphokinase